MSRIEEIKQRLNNTSSGVWDVKYGLGEGGEVISGVNVFGIATTRYIKDAEFIAKAKDDIEYLLKIIDKMENK